MIIIYVLIVFDIADGVTIATAALRSGGTTTLPVCLFFGQPHEGPVHTDDEVAGMSPGQDLRGPARPTSAVQNDGQRSEDVLARSDGDGSTIFVADILHRRHCR